MQIDLNLHIRTHAQARFVPGKKDAMMYIPIHHQFIPICWWSPEIKLNKNFFFHMRFPGRKYADKEPRIKFHNVENSLLYILSA